MKLITSNDVDYDNVEVLGKVFSASGLNAVAKKPEGSCNARVDITFPSTRGDLDLKFVVMVWVSHGQPEILKFRVVLFNRKERDRLKKNDELWERINETVGVRNQNAFASLSLSNLAGITIEYGLTMEGGITTSTLSNSAKEVARLAQGARSSITLFVDRSYAL